PTQIRDAQLNDSTIEYFGRETIYTNQKGQKKTVVSNTLGQDIEVRDHNNSSVTYAYDAFGNLVYLRQPTGHETKIGFNILGHKTRLEDPDQGIWIYRHDVLGQLVDQIDAKNQTIRTVYDVLGRMKVRTDLFGTSNAENTNWTYDDTTLSATAIGKLTAVTNNRNYNQTIRYDAFGRPFQTTTQIDGTSYTNTTTYDVLGRVQDITYPNGYTVRNLYHETLGTLDSIVKPGPDSTSSYTFWKAYSSDTEGQLERYTSGGIIATQITRNPATGMVENILASATWMPGFKYQDVQYHWDDVGNLESFQDLRQNIGETYAYDDLNRLNDVTGSNGVNSSTRFDATGNITNKSSVGSYGYNSVGVPTECGTLNHQAGPHAVRRITGAKANYFCYDANGNLAKDKNRQFKYTAFNKPYQITQGSAVTSFDYAPSRDRFKRVDLKGSLTTTTYYLGNYEKVVEGSTVKHKIMVGDVAQVIETQGQSVSEINYLLKDQLGSVSAIVNKVGTVKEELSYDAWGARRLTNFNQLIDPLNYRNAFTNRGFTGHEHVDSMGIIHMNGRVYDQISARFISPDPAVQAPANLQSLNRYSYVMNNPLSKYDPSGYYSYDDFEDDVKKAVKSIEDVHRLYIDYVVYLGQRDNVREYVATHSWAQQVLSAGTKLCGPMEFACSAALTYETARGAGMGARDARSAAIKTGAVSYMQMEFSNWVTSVVDNTPYEFGSFYNSNPTARNPFDIDFKELAKTSANDVFQGAVEDAAMDSVFYGESFKDSFTKSFTADRILNKFLNGFTKGFGADSFEKSFGRYLGSFELASDIKALHFSEGGPFDFLGGHFKLGDGIYKASESAMIGLVFGKDIRTSVADGMKSWAKSEGKSWWKSPGESQVRSTKLGGWALDKYDRAQEAREAAKTWAKSLIF
ncbi:MAG TPA: RHS repeat-associated core domain-containing protein, partial [Dongiaceae bacterium]|nr:RHS repeat-associated core domain-containing protein [Dongiaceae bacterium]